jgi:hypothetical protein
MDLKSAAASPRLEESKAMARTAKATTNTNRLSRRASLADIAHVPAKAGQAARCCELCASPLAGCPKAQQAGVTRPGGKALARRRGPAGKSKEANRAVKVSAARIAELEVQVEELEKKVASP